MWKFDIRFDLLISPNELPKLMIYYKCTTHLMDTNEQVSGHSLDVGVEKGGSESSVILDNILILSIATHLESR